MSVTATMSIPQRVARVQRALGQTQMDGAPMEISDFNQWHNGDGWPGDWDNGIMPPSFDQGPR